MWRVIRRVLAIARKEVLHVRRDTRTLYLALGMPVMLLLLFGFGVSFDMDHIQVVVLDDDRSDSSRELTERFFASGEFERVEAPPSQDGSPLRPDDAHELFESRLASAVMVIPAGFGRALASGRPSQVQLLVDGVEANTATQTLQKADAVMRVVSAAVITQGRPSALSAPFEVRVQTWFNPGARSALFLVPGLTAYILAIVCVILIALTIAREWERGSMQQLFVTPVSRLEIVIGKLLPYVGLGIVAVLLVLTTGAWVFEVPMRGSPIALAAASLLFLTGMLGQGLLISVVTKNQMVATQVSTMTSMLPSMLLSGFLFPIENMPLPLQVVSNVVPARYFIHALRGVLLRGNDLMEIRGDLLALAIFALVVLTLSTLRFKRELA